MEDNYEQSSQKYILSPSDTTYKFYYNVTVWATSFGRIRPSTGPLRKSFEQFSM